MNGKVVLRNGYVLFTNEMNSTPETLFFTILECRDVPKVSIYAIGINNDVYVLDGVTQLIGIMSIFNIPSIDAVMCFAATTNTKVIVLNFVHDDLCKRFGIPKTKIRSIRYIPEFSTETLYSVDLLIGYIEDYFNIDLKERADSIISKESVTQSFKIAEMTDHKEMFDMRSSIIDSESIPHKLEQTITITARSGCGKSWVYEKLMMATLEKRNKEIDLGGTNIVKVIYNNPATIVMWKDGTKTVVKCSENDTYDPEKGLAMCIAKKAMGNTGRYYDMFKKWKYEEE